MKQSFYKNEEPYNDFSIPLEKDDVSLNDPYTHSGKVVSKYFKEINVRQNPLSNASIVAVVKVGTILHYTPEIDNDFYPVRLDNGQTGYMMAKFIEEVMDE